MKRLFPALFFAFILFRPAAAPAQDAAKIVQPSAPPQAQTPQPTAPLPRPLTNDDVLRMVEAKLATEVVVEKVRTSPCDFDTSPAALMRLKEAGVPDALLLLMVLSPKCAPPPPPPARRVAVRVPRGTPVELETAYTINSQLVRAGDAVSFRVINPVIVDGQVVVEKGAAATAVVTKAERGGHFGRAGRLAWTMKEVTAADGTRLPLEFSGRTVGDSKGGKVATHMVLTGAIFWFAPPVALLHGFKRGGNAVVPEGKRFDATVSGAGVVSVTARP